MKRTASLAIGTVGLAVLVLGIAPAASADVTNPADNPHKITVTGDDGQTYTDGQDTLPGYDDYECTYIPGAWFDFAKNRVYYADGQWIPWTEWDRATGYKEWLAKQDSGSSGGSSSGGSSSGSTSGSTKSGSTKSTSTKSTSTKSTSTKSTSTTSGSTKSTTTTTTKTTESDTATSPSASPSPILGAVSSTPSASPSVTPESPSATPTAEASPVAAVAAGTDSGSSAGPGAGIAILGGLAAAGGVAYGATWFVRRGRERKAIGGLA
jgi:hypothetical protein